MSSQLSYQACVYDWISFCYYEDNESVLGMYTLKNVIPIREMGWQVFTREKILSNSEILPSQLTLSSI